MSLARLMLVYCISVSCQGIKGVTSGSVSSKALDNGTMVGFSVAIGESNCISCVAGHQ